MINRKTRMHLLAMTASCSCIASLGAFAATPSPPSKICVDDACSTTANTSTKSGIKWHPGHYTWLDKMPRRDTATTIKASHFSTIDGLSKEPTIKGVQVIMYWSALEGNTPGDYSAGFALIDEYLRKLEAAGNKRLMLGFAPAVFGTVSAGSASSYFPTYLNTSTYNGGWVTPASGEYWSGSLAVQIQYWVPSVMDRFIAMIQAYGKRYNSHPLFEMILTGETAVGVPSSYGFSNSALETQLERMHAAARAAWPNTAVRTTTNWLSPNSLFEKLFVNMKAHNITAGGPDVLPNEVIQGNQIFTGAIGGIDYRGVIPFVAEIESPSLGGKEGTFTPEQLYLAAMKGISTKSGGATGSGSAVFRATQPQYFVWYYNTWSGGSEQKWSTGILPFIRSINGAVYTTACPKGYSGGCITE